MAATYKLNEKLNGIEIYFDSFPGKEIISKFHNEKGWRWSKNKKCWYNKQNEENLIFAKNICNENNVKMEENINVHNVKIGDIFYTSYGYDMTLVSFYQVVRVTAKRASVREIANTVVSGNSGYTGEVVPKENSFISDITYTTSTNLSWDKTSVMLKNIDGHIGYMYENKPIYFNHMD